MGIINDGISLPTITKAIDDAYAGIIGHGPGSPP